MLRLIRVFDDFYVLKLPSVVQLKTQRPNLKEKLKSAVCLRTYSSFLTSALFQLFRCQRLPGDTREVFVWRFIRVKDLSLMNSHCELSALGMQRQSWLFVYRTLDRLASEAQCRIKTGWRRGAEGRPADSSEGQRYQIPVRHREK